jgi:hypothetical protein
MNIGIAVNRIEERVLAVTGLQDFAQSTFEHDESVLNAGVLLAIPALLSQGLDKAFKVYSQLPPGFYGLHHMLMLLSFMALCRIKTPEQLKKYSPGELGKLLGLDRIPEVGYFRKKIKQITSQAKTDELHKQLFQEWLGKLPELFFYIDGHVRVYHGSKANLPKRFVSREKLCLNGTTEFWINDGQGMPLMVITGELNEKLKTAIILAINEIKPTIPDVTDKTKPLFTLVFDREAYDPAWFKKLSEEENIAVITYRKNVKDTWDENLFKPNEVTLLNNNVTMQLCEMGVELAGKWFREIRKLSDSGHQTSILTTHPDLQIKDIAAKMFSRWSQENFFKYMSENFDFDRMIEYGMEAVEYETTIPNPEYRKLSYQLKKSREKKRRLEARIFNKMDGNNNETIAQVMKDIAQSSDLIEQINQYSDQINELLEQRSKVPSRTTVEDMPEETRYNKLKQESKKLKNAILMIAYRAETALYNLMDNEYKNTKKDGRVILKEIFTNEADLNPDYEAKKLNVIIHSMSTKRANKVVAKLCEFMNQTETCYPGTNLTLFFKSIAE